jgi:hypothetical protein
MFLNKDQILAAKDGKYEDIDVPEWGGTVRIKCMTGSERDSYEASLYDLKGTEVKLNREDMRAKLLARVIVNEHGKRLFADGEIKILGEKSAPVLEKLHQIAQRINAISNESVEAAVKNSESGGVAISTSLSPANSE